MKKLFLILFYLSLIFLVVYLYKANFFVMPNIKSWSLLVISVILLFVGSISQSITWKSTLSIQGINITSVDSIVSTGRSVFMKYLPGKVFSILGRASFISSKYNVSLGKTSSASLVTQIVSLIVGTLFSSILLFNRAIDPQWRIMIFIMLICLTLFLLMFNKARKYIFWAGRKFRRKIVIPKIHLNGRISIIVPFLLNWLLWGLGFMALCLSISGDISWYSIFIFPISSVIGIASLLTPGGLGVREGAITICLVAIDVPIEIATTISIFSRLWFLIGEFLIFLLSIYLGMRNKILTS